MKLFKAGNEKRHNIRVGANTNTQNRVNVQHDLGVVQSSHQNLDSDEDWVIVNDKDHEISAILRGSEVIPSKDLGLEYEILTGFPDSCNRSHTIELKDEDLYLIVPRNLTFAEITSILDQAVKEGNCEKLDEVVQKIGDYEGRSIALDDGSFKNFCSNQLNLDLQNSDDHRHIYSNVLLQYKFDQKELKRDYSVKELVLLAVAANDKLAEKYQKMLFVEENLSLFPLLVGGQKYIETFIAKFHGVDGIYDKLKNQAIQLVELSKIGFFSAMALRKEQNLLDTVFVEYVLKDLEQVLKTSGLDSTYGVLETASLVQNEEFITIVLHAFERYINEPNKKASIEELLKKSFATLLETAISQEHVSIVECLCKKCTENKGPVIQGIYKEAFADNRVVEQLNKQIIKKIISGGTNGSRKEKAEKIYDLVLKAALDVGNITFIEHLCKKYTKCSNDVIDYLGRKLKGNEFDNVYESTLTALSNSGNEGTIVTVLTHIQIYQNVPNSERIIRHVVQNILKNAIEREDCSIIKLLCNLKHSNQDTLAIQKIYKEEFQQTLLTIDKERDKVSQLLDNRPKEVSVWNLSAMVCNTALASSKKVMQRFNKVATPHYNQVQEESEFSLEDIKSCYIATQRKEREEAYEKEVNFDYEYMKNIDIHSNLLHIRCLLQDGIVDVRPLASGQRANCSGTGSQQPQKNTVDKRKNIMDNRNASLKHSMSNNYKEGEMHGSDQGTKSIEERLSESGNVLGVSTATSDQPVNIDDEKKQLSDQSTTPKSTDKEQAAEQKPLQVEGKSGFEGKRDPLLPESSASSGSSSSGFINVSTSGGGVTDSSNGKYAKVRDIVADTALKGIGSPQDTQTEASKPLSSASLIIGNMPTAEELAVVTANIGDSQQLKTSPFDSEPRRMGAASSTTALSVKSDKKKQAPVQPAKDIAQIDDDDDYDLSWIFLEEDDQNLHPVEPIPSLTSKKPKQVNNTTLQNTKSGSLHIVAASVLTTAGFALGVAITVHLEMLVLGIAVGACCLVAATVMYHYKWPSSFIENNQIEKVTLDEEKGPVAKPV